MKEILLFPANAAVIEKNHIIPKNVEYILVIQNQILKNKKK
jgi:hypothetical protein